MIRSSVLAVKVAFLFSLSCVAVIFPCAPAANELEEKPSPAFELIGLDERAGRAVLLSESAQTIVLQRDEETTEGIRLKSVANGAVLIDVRDGASGEIIAYRIRLGETFRIRPLRKQDGQDVQVIAITPESGLATKELPPARD